MNTLKATISNIEAVDELLLISLKNEHGIFSSLMINNNEDYIQEGKDVIMVFKETEVSLVKDFSGALSIRNRFPSVIREIINGKILSEIHLDYHGNKLCSVITRPSCEAMGLKAGDLVTALLKTNELLLMKAE